MQKRTLGTSNLEVSAVGLGCMGISSIISPEARAATLKLVPRQAGS